MDKSFIQTFVMVQILTEDFILLSLMVLVVLVMKHYGCLLSLNALLNSSELLAFCDTKRALQIINSIIKTNLRLSSIDNKSTRLQLQNDVLFSPAELKKIANGALSGNRTVLKLCFGLHCSLSQSEQLLNSYGYCWQDDEVSSFLREELSLKRYKATDILCDWEIYARKLVA